MPTNDASSGHISPFESIKHTDEYGEYWSARELAKVLEYTSWQHFAEAVERAKVSCATSGKSVDDHFNETVRVMEGGRWGKHSVRDVQLSRYACYLIVQTADPSKRIVALGQAYFYAQIRRSELAQELVGKTEEQQRLLLRDQIAEQNGHLAEAASVAGVVTQRDFAIFQDHGYRGLYNETARQIAQRKGLQRGEHILDRMGSEEMVDNLFRVVQAEAKIRREEIGTKDAANAAHHQIGQAVREAIIGMGGTPPEQLATPDKSIHLVRREEARRLKIEADDRLGLFAQLNAPEDPIEDDGDEQRPTGNNGGE
jgi:DNA-damage-inducible protein D